MDTAQDEVNLSSQKKHYSKLHSLKILVSNYLNAQYKGIKNILFRQPTTSEKNNEVEQVEKNNEVENSEKNRKFRKKRLIPREFYEKVHTKSPDFY